MKHKKYNAVLLNQVPYQGRHDFPTIVSPSAFQILFVDTQINAPIKASSARCSLPRWRAIAQ